MKKVEPLLRHPVSVGFIITALIALFIRYGISFVLFLLNKWQISNIITLILYGLIFIVARVGMRNKPPLETPFIEGNPTEELEDTPEKQSTRSFIFKVVWTTLALYSILWITPGFVLFWIYGDSCPNEMIKICVYILSLITATIYFWWYESAIVTRSKKMMFFAGAVCAVIATVYITF